MRCFKYLTESQEDIVWSLTLNDKQTKTSKEGLISVSHPLAAKISHIRSR